MKLKLKSYKTAKHENSENLLHTPLRYDMRLFLLLAAAVGPAASSFAPTPLGLTRVDHTSSLSRVVMGDQFGKGSRLRGWKGNAARDPDAVAKTNRRIFVANVAVGLILAVPVLSGKRSIDQFNAPGESEAYAKKMAAKKEYWSADASRKAALNERAAAERAAKKP